MRDEASHIAKNPKYDGHQRGLASMVFKNFNKKSSSLADKSATAGSGFKNMSNEKLVEELHKSIIRKFEKRKVYSCFERKYMEY